MRTILSWITWFVLACQFVGCSEPPQLIPVSGTVLIDGEPLSGGTIRFVPAGGRPVGSKIMENGSFQLGTSSVSSVGGVDGVPPGKYRIAVSSSIILSEEEGTIKWVAPSRYADFRTSELEADLQTPEENLLVELTWEGSDPDSESETPEESASPDEDETNTTTVPETDTKETQPQDE
jgi:hypothetical protein